MKRSRKVPLVLLGSFSLLVSCGQDKQTEIRQHTYASREDCLEDWGRDERDCHPAKSGGYAGPRYFWHHSGGYPVAIDTDGSTRPLPRSNLAQPGATTRATSTHTMLGHVGGATSIGKTTARVGGGSGHTTRGGFGGMAFGFSGG